MRRTSRYSEQRAMLKALIEVQRGFRDHNIPKRKRVLPSGRKRRGFYSSISEFSMDMNARLPRIIRNVRCGEIGLAAYKIGFIAGINLVKRTLLRRMLVARRKEG